MFEPPINEVQIQNQFPSSNKFSPNPKGKLSIMSQSKLMQSFKKFGAAPEWSILYFTKLLQFGILRN
jgi:hypothetical protein